MFRIEPVNPDFLQTKPKTFVCRVPPLDFNFVELVDMHYFAPNHTFRIRCYGYSCKIIASGIYMSHDILKSTLKEELFIIEVRLNRNPYYFLMKEEEQDKYMFLDRNRSANRTIKSKMKLKIPIGKEGKNGR